MTTASLSFLPWVRQGAAAAIKTADTLGAQQGAFAGVAAALTLNGEAVTEVPTVRLRGPADVVGIDVNQVVRTDPRPATTDFEPNCFASIEFDRADFPWLFTPARAHANTQLRPWLCLVVVRKQEGVTLTQSAGAPLPILQIALPAKQAAELPDLKDSWAWAHAQVAADDSTEARVRTALNGAPEQSLSRLVCPRILAPNTDYIACVVPSFDVGCKAGLGLSIAEADLAALKPAWSLAPPPPTQAPPLLLPVYHQWEFRTGQGGDFESLARLLTPTVPEGLGQRTIDISQPGFAAAGASTQEMEGALLPILAAGSPVPPPPAPLPQEFQANLAAIINEPSRSQAAAPDADPLLAPQLYGRWHAGKASVVPGGASWFDQLNLDPRWRAAAALGTRVVQEHQEALMASAWEQAAELQSANQRLRQLQLSLAVGEVIHARHFAAASIGEEMLLRLTAPAFGRLREAKRSSSLPGPAQSLLARQADSILPVGANRSAMRRIGRQRGPLSRRTAGQDVQRSPVNTWVARLNAMGGDFPAPPAPPAAPDFCVMPSLPIQHLGNATVAGDSFFGAFFVAPENAPVLAPGAPFLIAGATEVAGFFRAAAVSHIERFFVPIVIRGHLGFLFKDFKTPVIEQTRPRVALAALVRSVVSLGDSVLSPSAQGVTPLGMETIMAAPSFTQPMYESLRDLSQELLLPGLDKVKPNTVVGLKTNRRFVESYLVGLNHEMGRELLWRGYPTDQRGTYFMHFWGAGVPNSAPADITELNTWAQRSLGSAEGAPPLAEEFVMMLRSSLLQRYPNAVIYLTPALRAGAGPDPTALVPDEVPAHEKPPIFSGSMQPDVSFFGFPVTTARAIGTGKDGDLGFYLVIQEHPTEPRFGTDAGLASLANISHLAIGTAPPAGWPANEPGDAYQWGKNAAHMAGLTRRLPVRVAIHASRLITPA